jgi:2-aminoadipate transaminase
MAGISPASARVSDSARLADALRSLPTRFRHPDPRPTMDQPITPSFTFSERAQRLTSSAIREILKVTERPDVISFAGGLPSPDGFPIDVIKEAFARVLSTNGRVALQYGPTEGFAPLRQWVADDLTQRGARVAADEVLIVSGSQQGLDLLGKALIDTGSRILVETPSYLGALQSFAQYQPHIDSAPTDDGGLDPAALTAAMCVGARFLYALPNFQNPTGRTLDLARRVALLEKAAQYRMPVIEDDPYGDLRYAGTPQPGLIALAPESGATVIRLGSFSKVLAPGLRLGYIAGPKALIAKLAQLKQATDLHTSSVTQMAVHEIVKSGFLATHVPRVQAIYGEHCVAMLEALDEHFPKSARWTRPEGGMFIWVTLAGEIDTTELLQRAIERLVAFVPGAPFFAQTPQRNTLRLSFVTVPPEKIREGIARLASLL